jgi:hypothetical protein
MVNQKNLVIVAKSRRPKGESRRHDFRRYGSPRKGDEDVEALNKRLN